MSDANEKTEEPAVGRREMFAVAGRTAATRAAAPLARRAGQRRNMGVLDWMVNYPDKVRVRIKLIDTYFLGVGISCSIEFCTI